MGFENLPEVRLSSWETLKDRLLIKLCLSVSSICVNLWFFDCIGLCRTNNIGGSFLIALIANDGFEIFRVPLDRQNDRFRLNAVPTDRDNRKNVPTLRQMVAD